MNRISWLIWGLAALLIPASGMADDEFVAVDPATLESVSGKKLMMICYGIICGMLMLYSLVLLLRERACNRRIEDLRNRIR